jgi:hypothetical protein
MKCVPEKWPGVLVVLHLTWNKAHKWRNKAMALCNREEKPLAVLKECTDKVPEWSDEERMFWGKPKECMDKALEWSDEERMFWDKPKECMDKALEWLDKEPDFMA